MRNSTSLFTNDRGVVIMETLLMLPVYLIMLSGIFWLGELCLARLAFTEGENIRLWEAGLRHSFTSVPERTLFSFLPSTSSNQMITGSSSFNFTRTSPAQTGGWGVGIAGSASILTRRSDWSWAVNQGALQALGENNNVSNDITIRGKNRGLLNRNSYTGRQNLYYDGTSNGTSWKNEYGARWTVGSAVIEMPSGGTARNVSLYNRGSRNSNYNRWSL